MDNFLWWLVYQFLPYKLVYYCFIRVGSYASMELSNVEWHNITLDKAQTIFFNKFIKENKDAND